MNCDLCHAEATELEQRPDFPGVGPDNRAPMVCSACIPAALFSLRVTFHTDPPYLTDVPSFVADNADDAEFCQEVWNLAPGAHIEIRPIGSSSSPYLKVERIDRDPRLNACCPDDCQNFDATACPECFAETGTGCPHGERCAECQRGYAKRESYTEVRS
jgi:hypothetical protein